MKTEILYIQMNTVEHFSGYGMVYDYLTVFSDGTGLFEEEILDNVPDRYSAVNPRVTTLDKAAVQSLLNSHIKSRS